MFSLGKTDNAPVVAPECAVVGEKWRVGRGRRNPKDQTGPNDDGDAPRPFHPNGSMIFKIGNTFSPSFSRHSFKLVMPTVDTVEEPSRPEQSIGGFIEQFKQPVDC